MSLEVGRLSTSDAGYFNMAYLVSGATSVGGRVITTAIEYPAISGILGGVTLAIMSAKMARKEWSLTSDDFSPTRFTVHVVLGTAGAGVAALGVFHLFGGRSAPVVVDANTNGTNTTIIEASNNITEASSAIIQTPSNVTEASSAFSIEDITVPYAPGFKVSVDALPDATQKVLVDSVPEVAKKVASVFDKDTMCALRNVTLPVVADVPKPVVVEAIKQTITAQPEVATQGWGDWLKSFIK